MISRINCYKIVVGHFNTLRSLGQESKRIYWQDFVLFILLPLLISFVCTYYNLGFRNQLSNLIAAISILGGFLFNLLAIIYNSMENLKKSSGENMIKKKYTKEIHSNISYNILIAIFCIVCLLIYNVEIPNFIYCWIVERVVLFLNYFFLISFFLTLLMVLNRVYILLDRSN